ncbi:MAG: molybdenum cofactor biosynthesis protein MoaE [Planctomycetes bacterium]|nr:molybdenum cofactor biosynthesis protein MoaE [Planctomycetota bacterium]
MIELTDAVIDPARLIAAVAGPDCGALALFLGTVRDSHEGRKVLRLSYEAYRPMALNKLQEIQIEIAQQWPGTRVALVHRLGTLGLGEISVGIAAASPHRDAAFAACRHAIEQIKAVVPIWKKEFWADGTQWVGQPESKTS